jgi:hypothetical protein
MYHEVLLFMFLITGAIFAAVLSYILGKSLKRKFLDRHMLTICKAVQKSTSHYDTKITDHTVQAYQVETETVMEVVTYSLHLAVQSLSKLCLVPLSPTFEVIEALLRKVFDNRTQVGLEDATNILISGANKYFEVCRSLLPIYILLNHVTGL